MKVGDTVSFLNCQEYGTASGGIQKKETVRKGKIVKIDDGVATVKYGSGCLKKMKLSDLEVV